MHLANFKDNNRALSKIAHISLPTGSPFIPALEFDNIQVVPEDGRRLPARQTVDVSTYRSAVAWLAAVHDYLDAYDDVDTAMAAIARVAAFLQDRASEIIVLATQQTELSELVVSPADLDPRMTPEHRDRIVAEKRRALRRTLNLSRKTGADPQQGRSGGK